MWEKVVECFSMRTGEFPRSGNPEPTTARYLRMVREGDAYVCSMVGPPEASLAPPSLMDTVSGSVSASPEVRLSSVLEAATSEGRRLDRRKDRGGSAKAIGALTACALLLA